MMMVSFVSNRVKQSLHSLRLNTVFPSILRPCGFVFRRSWVYCSYISFAYRATHVSPPWSGYSGAGSFRFNGFWYQRPLDNTLFYNVDHFHEARFFKITNLMNVIQRACFDFARLSITNNPHSVFGFSTYSPSLRFTAYYLRTTNYTLVNHQTC